MNEKIMHVVLIVSLFLVTPVYADKQQPSVDTIITKMQSQLVLTPAQVNVIKPIIEDEYQKLKKILNSDQMIQWLNMQSQMHQKHKKSKHAAASGSSGTSTSTTGSSPTSSS